MRAKVDRSVISVIERGHLESISIGTLLRIARVLEIQVGFTARWRAGDLDRLLSSRHSGLHEAVARWFATELPNWVLAPEVSYSIFGERGVIDILAGPGRRALLVIELKTDIADVNEVVGSMDRRGDSHGRSRETAVGTRRLCRHGCSSPAAGRTEPDSRPIGWCSGTLSRRMVELWQVGSDARIMRSMRYRSGNGRARKARSWQPGVGCVAQGLRSASICS